MERKNISREFKITVLQELETGKTIAQVCREHNFKKDVVYRWRAEYRKDPLNAFAGKGNAASQEARCAQMERTIGQLYLEIDFLKKVQRALRTRLTETKNER